MQKSPCSPANPPNSSLSFILIAWLGFFWQQHLASGITATVSICYCFRACGLREPATLSCREPVPHRSYPSIGAPLLRGTSIPPTLQQEACEGNISTTALVRDADVPIQTGWQMGLLSAAACPCLHLLCCSPADCARHATSNACGCLSLLEGPRRDDGKHSATWITAFSGKTNQLQVRTGNVCQWQWCTYNMQ